ncbi:type IX secretion system motor protein PorM/GldM [Lutibacter flavus]|uniref:Protein involved in gliding motility GldM n=1 Tax=Lutibacter flavus TaxID=691689 RepID=A0A238Z673_9FLAO|nr:gliding motility protein GldM [Lutibacter flavus]SNR78549.1 protein involved in gliding motility GldM [Lutibacter flavus]
MASGNLSPRQKMINLMYLVFIAMLAMNMSKEVLSAFGFMNEKLADNNITATIKNSEILANLSTKASEQPEKYSSLFGVAQKVDQLSKDFDSYLESKKVLFLEEQEDKKNYEAMDQSVIVDEHFFKNNQLTTEGQEFLDYINGYRDSIIQLLNPNSPLVASIKKRFDTSDQPIADALKPQPWLNNRYEGFPLISTVTNLTSMQTDIKTTQSDVFGSLLGGQLESDVSLTNYEAIVVADKTAFFQGEKFTGKIYLGKKDPTLKADVVEIGGRALPESSIQAGQVLLDFPAGNVGEHDIKGKFVFTENGKPVEIPITSSYAVIPKPNSAVISADKMNVVYMGVANPMTISIPGIPDNLVTASANGLRRSTGSGKYIMTPSGGREVSIKVSGKLPNGQMVSSSQNFRVKQIPSPQGTIRKQSGHVKMPKASLEKSTVGTELPDFDFDLNLSTTGFTLKVPGQGAVVVRGSRMDAAAKKAIAKAKRGDVVTIFDIKSSLVGNSGYKIKNASPVSVEIQ